MYPVYSPRPAQPKTLEIFARLQQANARVASADARPDRRPSQVGVPVAGALLLGFAVLLVAGTASPDNAMIVVPSLIGLLVVAFFAVPAFMARRQSNTVVDALRPPYSSVNWEEVSKEAWDSHPWQVLDAVFEDPMEREDFLEDLRLCASEAGIAVLYDPVGADTLVAASVEDVYVVFVGSPEGTKRPEPCRWDGISFYSESRIRQS